MSKFREIVAETFNRINKRDSNNTTDSSGNKDMNDKTRKDKNH